MSLSELIFGGGVSVAIVGILGKYLEFRWLSKSQKKDAADTINVIAKIYKIMQNVVSETECDRFIIFKVENGGGAPKVGAHIYTSALMESYKDHAVSVADNFQRLKVDSTYTVLLSNMLAAGKIHFNVEEMPESLLKTLYRAEDVKYSEIHHLHTTTEAIYYCSLATSKEDESFTTPSTALKIELAINEIVELFKKHI